MRQVHLLLLGLILLIALFFRSYQMVERFGYAHDGDLYSWIVKDIVVDKHFRLVGQITSFEGIFIGPLFYYLLIPFFLLFKMDPIGSAFFTLFIGTATILSYYFVLSKLFNKYVGLIAAFLHAVSWSTIGFDRWMVPTITTKLWTVWYLYVLFLIIRRQFWILPLLGVLMGLIWHVHLALLPALLAIPVAFYVSGKLPTLKESLLFGVSFILTTMPLILFEVKHGFIQFNSLISSFSNNRGMGEVGLYKLQVVLGQISENTTNLIFSPLTLPQNYRFPITIMILLSVFWLAKEGILKLNQIIVLFSWILGIVIYFTLSSVLTSEYYFSNLEIIFMLIISLLLYSVVTSFTFGKVLIFAFLVLIFIRNLYLYLTFEPYHVGYVERKSVTEYIVKDSREKNFPCVGINYITLPGENVGFRYLFYLHKLKTVPPTNKVPVYSIVFPYEWSEKEVKAIFGHMGVIPPAKILPRESLEYNCSGENANLTDSMFGYVE